MDGAVRRFHGELERPLRRGYGVGYLNILPGIVVQQRQPVIGHQPGAHLTRHAAQQKLVVPQPGPETFHIQLCIRQRQMQLPVPAHRHGKQQQIALQRLLQWHTVGRAALFQAPGHREIAVLPQQLGQVYLAHVSA